MGNGNLSVNVKQSYGLFIRKCLIVKQTNFTITTTEEVTHKKSGALITEKVFIVKNLLVGCDENGSK